MEITRDQCTNLLAIRSYVLSIGGSITYPPEIMQELIRFEMYQDERMRISEARGRNDNLGELLRKHHESV